MANMLNGRWGPYVPKTAFDKARLRQKNKREQKEKDWIARLAFERAAREKNDLNSPEEPVKYNGHE